MNGLLAGLPRPFVDLVRRLKLFFRWLPYMGRHRYCPVCRTSSRRFRRFGLVPREDAECARCGSLERQRLLWLFVERKTDLFDGRAKKVLHVAPEICLARPFGRRLGEHYITADLVNPRAMLQMDITNIDFPAGHFDVVYCSHVLEHVPDDRKAMREFHRVLDAAGWAILLVPITADRTIEDPSVTDPEERARLFGQHDHVRRYGPDYVDRLRESGFKVSICSADDLASPDERVRLGLTDAAGEIYFCTK